MERQWQIVGTRYLNGSLWKRQESLWCLPYLVMLHGRLRPLLALRCVLFKQGLVCNRFLFKVCEAWNSVALDAHCAKGESEKTRPRLVRYNGWNNESTSIFLMQGPGVWPPWGMLIIKNSNFAHLCLNCKALFSWDIQATVSRWINYKSSCCLRVRYFVILLVWYYHFSPCVGLSVLGVTFAYLWKKEKKNFKMTFLFTSPTSPLCRRLWILFGSGYASEACMFKCSVSQCIYVRVCVCVL